MKKMPDSIKEHISNAKYYLEAADEYPIPTKNAIHILLLLIGWENLVIANSELSAWANETDVHPSIYKSHAAKLKTIPKITRVIRDSLSKTREINYSSGRNFEELRLACQYGSNTESKDVNEIFKSGWHLDGLRNGLISRIKWLKVSIAAYEGLLKDEKK